VTRTRIIEHFKRQQTDSSIKKIRRVSNPVSLMLSSTPNKPSPPLTHGAARLQVSEALQTPRTTLQN
jgi:hypothetical protein